MYFEKETQLDSTYGITDFKCTCTCNGGHGHSGTDSDDKADYQTKTYEEGKNS